MVSNLRIIWKQTVQPADGFPSAERDLGRTDPEPETAPQLVLPEGGLEISVLKSTAGFGMMVRNDCTVLKLPPPSAAAKAGLLLGCTIVAVNGEPVADKAAFGAAIKKARMGDVVRFATEPQRATGVSVAGSSPAQTSSANTAASAISLSLSPRSKDTNDVPTYENVGKSQSCMVSEVPEDDRRGNSAIADMEASFTAAAQRISDKAANIATDITPDRSHDDAPLPHVSLVNVLTEDNADPVPLSELAQLGAFPYNA